MDIYEIVGGAFLLVCSIALTILCLLQGKKDQGMTSAITGSQNDSAYSKNSSRTIEAKLARTTKIFAILFFVAAIVSNVLPVFLDK